MKPQLTAFFDDAPFAIGYVLAGRQTQRCAVVDSVPDFGVGSESTPAAAANAIVAFVNSRQIETARILETRRHADNLSSVRDPRARLAIGSKITGFEKNFATRFNAGMDFKRTGRMPPPENDARPHLEIPINTAESCRRSNHNRPYPATSSPAVTRPQGRWGD